MTQRVIPQRRVHMMRRKLRARHRARRKPSNPKHQIVDINFGINSLRIIEHIPTTFLRKRQAIQ
jgi:hypothetical protein